MKVEEVAIDSLIPYGFNNVKHSDTQVDRLAYSIKEYGWTVPLLVNKDNIVIAGHGRLLAAKKLGLNTVPVIRKEGLTEAQERAYRVLDNKLTRDSDWDFENLQVEFDFLKENDFDFGKWGLDNLIPQPEINIEVVQDNHESKPVDEIETFLKRGDLIELGRHRVLCGDSTELEGLSYLFDVERWDMLLTSPPYNSGNGGYKSDYYAEKKRFYVADTDDRTEEEWVQFCNSILTSAHAFQREDSSVVVWNVMYTARCRAGYGKVLFGGAQPYTVKETICWDKGNGFPTASKGIYSRNWELVFVLSSGDKYQSSQKEHEVRWAKWEIYRDQQHENHGATFPTAFASRAVGEFSFSDQVVYDPFLGSGTTLIAAEQLNRTCYGMELEPRYCQVILDRYKKFCEDNQREFVCKINGEPYGG